MTTPGVRGRQLLALLRWCLPPGPAGRSILGDVLEEYHERQPGLVRDLWLAGAVLPLAARYLLPRLFRSSGPGPIRVLSDDVRSGLRALRRDRTTVAIAVITLAAGIGPATAILSAIHGSLLKPLPFHDPATVVLVGDRSTTTAADRITGNIGLANVRDLGSDSETLLALAAYRDLAPTISGVGDAQHVRGQEVDAPFFDVLGVRPIAGRLISTADQAAGAPLVVVVTEALARQLFGTSDLAIGRLLQVDGGPHVVVGVVRAVTQLGNPQLWLPLKPHPNILRRNSRQVYAVARLAPGVAIEAARQELSGRFEALRLSYPEIGESRSVGVMPIADWITGERGPRLLGLLGSVVVLVLVIAAANVSGLLLLRAERRQQDLAVRSALGASRLRLTRELVVEGLAIAVAAAGLGLVFAAWCTALLVDLYGSVLPRSWEIGLHPPVVAATVVLAVVIGVVIALAPASRLSMTRALDRAAGRTATRMSATQRALVWSQTAIAMLLIGLAALVISSVARLSAEDPGLNPEGVLVFDVSLTGRVDPAELPRFFRSYLDRLEGLQGVMHAAVTSRRPLFGGNNTGLTVPGVPEAITRDAVLEIRSVTEAYFEALGVRLTSGRPLNAADAAGAPVVVVNRAFETAFFEEGGAVGRLLQPSGQERTSQIVGVVEDIREFGPAAPARPTAYWPYGNGPYGTSSWMTVLVRRRAGDPLALVPSARAILADLDPHVALDAPVTLTELVTLQAGRDRLAVRALLTLAAGLALLLTVIGLYSVLSYVLSRRVREIGIRRALGATRSGVVRLLLAQGIGLAGPGLVAGLAAAALGGRFLTSYLHDVSPGDPAALAGSAGILGLAALTASYVPAWRAGRVEAIEALRHE